MSQFIQACIALVALTCALPDAGAETVFKCKGPDGSMHYQNTRCLQSDEVSHWAPREFTAIPYKPAALVIAIDRSMAYRVNGEIEGATVSMQVDTGAAMVSIPAALADKLKLVRGQPQQFSTANGLTMGYKTVIRTLKIGDFTLKDVDAAIMTNLPSGVLLGQTALGRLKVEQSKGELRIFAP